MVCLLTTAINSVRHHAHAKLNLTLRVIRPRTDGYHDIESLVVFTRLADRLKIISDERISLQLHGPFAETTSTGTRNSVVQAAHLFAAMRNISSGWRIVVEKQIPPAAGLGGGSSDAAAMLTALEMLHGAMAAEEKRALALSLGADVLVCLLDRASMVRGWGEKIQPVVTPLPEMSLLLVKPLGMLLAGEVYQRVDEIAGREEKGEGKDPPDSMNLAALLSWCRERPNELELAAISLLPEIHIVLSALEGSEGCLLARMTGSGPVCFGVYEKLAQAKKAKKKLGERHPEWWLHVDTLNQTSSKYSAISQEHQNCSSIKGGHYII